ncbi:MAG: PQQ-binding-like beta-propeller repeat protein [Verrucomicrobiales bacterium]|nr:PQQ-binding-like beta-propeller repeat protein [Verrucomicrobiales bacterium]
MKRNTKFTTLALLLLLGAVALFLILSQGITAMNWMIPALLLAWLLLFGIWFLGFGNLPFKKRIGLFLIGLGVFFTLGFLGKFLLRYEGSSSGSSFPKFAWVWEKEAEAAPPGKALVRTEVSQEEQRLQDATADSTDFLGPDRDGTWAELPFSPEWSSSPPELLWRRAVGKAWSSFAVENGKAITQEQAGNAERILCLHLFTGEEIWHHENPDTRLLLVKKENTGVKMGGDGPRSTPVIHENKVIVVGATGIVNCLDLENGTEIWSANTIRDFGGEVQKWGIANAPLILPTEKAVLVAGTDSVSGEKGVTYAAFALDSGEVRWTYRGEGASYSSPRLLEISGTRQIVSINRESVSGIDPSTGDELWRFAWKGHYPKVGQPLQVDENTLLVTASYGAGSLLLDLTREGNSWTVSERWKSNRMKTKFSSAVILGNLAYGLDEGRLAAIDLETGDKAWKNQKYGFGQQLLFGDHLLVQVEQGPVVIGKASPEGFEELGRIEDALSSMTWNIPVVAGRILLVRNDREAACYLLPKR